MSKKSKTRTNSNRQSFKFRWWMAAGLVVFVALVGVLVLRYSHASVASAWIEGHYCEYNSGEAWCTLNQGNPFSFQDSLSTGGSVWLCSVGQPTYTSGKYVLTKCRLTK